MRVQEHKIQFFLGANSADGFSSLYNKWVDQESVQAYYVLKGGAGCGKSTLMNRVAEAMENIGCSVEYICCSGDPDSLDGIYIAEKDTAIVDGTSPHIIEPAFTGASGHYIDLGKGYDRNRLFTIREEIIAASHAYQSCYPHAYQCFYGALESWKRGYSPMRTAATLEKVQKRTTAILRREMKRSCMKEGHRLFRFLDGITCKGRVFLEETVCAYCDRGYEIQDDYGLAGDLLAGLEKEFLEKGYDVISCPNPLNPVRLAHLLVPELSLAFVSGVRHRENFRTIRTESLVEKSALQEGKSFLFLSNRVASELIQEGIDYLVQAKSYHDALEEMYRPYIDFSHAEEQTDLLIKEILSLPDIRE